MCLPALRTYYNMNNYVTVRMIDLYIYFFLIYKPTVCQIKIKDLDLHDPCVLCIIFVCVQGYLAGATPL